MNRDPHATEEPSRIGRVTLFAALGPGLLVAATGVGAGDLATGALAGSKLGTTVLWAAVLGALFKFLLTEGLARFQIATGQTLLEGALGRTVRPLRFLFLLYLLPWSWFVGSALVSACGVAAHALIPDALEIVGSTDAVTGKVVWGTACSLAGLALVLLGGYRTFERVMRVCVGLMFVVVLATATMVVPDWNLVFSGLVPRLPTSLVETEWTLAVIGGIGGTLTILCYGYWIREEGRDGPEHLALCRADLTVGYAVTALFGMAMVVLGSALDEPTGSGATLILDLGDRLGSALGETPRILFLVGAFCAVFSSLLGVWQSVPYLFADFWNLARTGRPAPVRTDAPAYRAYAVALAIVPLLGLRYRFVEIQRVTALVGALVVPLLALALLLLNRRRIVGAYRNGRLTTVLLVVTLAFFVVWEIVRRTG